MKSVAISVLVSVALGIFGSGCAQHSVYLQDVRVEAPYVQPPLFSSKDRKEGSLHFVPRIAVIGDQKLSGRIEGHSKVDGSGVYRVDTVGANKYIERRGVNTKSFQGKNFSWDPAKINAAVDFEYAVARTMSIVFGANYSSGSSRNYLGGTAGLGFFFESKSLGGRFDLGVQMTSSRYSVDYVVSTSRDGNSDADVEFLTKEGKEAHTNIYCAFTLNTLFQNSPVQLFMQLAINRQNLLNFSAGTPHVHDYTVAQSTSFFTVSPGVAVDLSPTTRLMTGIRLGDETALLDADRGVLLAPFLQFEFGL